MAFLLPCCISIFTLLASIHHVTGLQCYACADAGTDNDCLQYETYVDAMSGKRPGVLKNCSASYDTMCFIETYSGGGLQVSHIRDCGDGIFSFMDANNNGTSDYPRLDELETNNETACVFTGLHQICVSKCVTDFCNGPLVTDVSAANARHDPAFFKLLLCIFFIAVIRL